jgi:hypothetical protein
MNFCAALGDLVRATDVNTTATTWNSLLQLITDAIKKDLNVDFLRPAALAAIRLCKSPVSIVDGPSGAAVPTDHFAVSIGL